jgi:hypothetical protein
MATFQHGKNGFLALGYETVTGATPIPTLTAGISATTAMGTIGGFTNSLLDGNKANTVVSGATTYGIFLGGVPNYLTASVAATGGTLAVSATAATSAQVLSMVNISPYINDISFPQQIETNETTTFSAAGVKTYIVGLRGWTISFGGMLDLTVGATNAPGGIDKIMSNIIDFQNISSANLVSFVYGPATPGALGGGTADLKYYGQAILSKYDLKSSVSGVVTFDGELQVTGAVYRTTLL